MTWHFSLSTYSQNKAREYRIAAQYLEDQAKGLQDQVPQVSPCWNLMEVSQERKNAREESKGVAVKHRIAPKEKPTPELSHINPRSAALLVMDYQVDVLPSS
jgi:hypothetical protein